MRTIGRLILSAVFLFLTAALGAVALYMPQPLFSFYTDFSRDAAAFLSGVTGSFPFAVWQVLLILLVLLELYGLVRSFARKKGFIYWLSGVVLLVSVLCFVFTGLWGVNHFAPPVSQRLGLTVETYSKEQLRDTTRYMAQQASYWAGQVQREENGAPAVDFSAAADRAGAGYEILAAEENDFFRPDGTVVKKLMGGQVFSHLGLTGIYVAFTGESCVNPDTYSASVPYTMCHELAHALTVAPEDEANFCAFLACTANPDPVFQYSGWYSAFVYTYNALQKVDQAAAAEIWDSLSAPLLQDCRNASAHYDRYEGEVKEAAEKVNDAYLKVFREESGVESYGEVTDLLIAWYLQN